MNAKVMQPCKALFNATAEPTRATLTACLGASAPLWTAVIDVARERFPRLAEAWNFAGAKIGWSLRLVADDRIIVYLTPGEGAFRVGLVLGSKIIEIAREAGLSSEAAAVVDAAPRNAEGHGLRFMVTSPADVALASELIALKAAVVPRTPRRKPAR